MAIEDQRASVVLFPYRQFVRLAEWMIRSAAGHTRDEISEAKKSMRPADHLSDD